MAAVGANLFANEPETAFISSDNQSRMNPLLRCLGCGPTPQNLRALLPFFVPFVLAF
ncbi:hypothetical protein J2T60_001140 [Natronospira proteinivora]|uniref:Uncharacterized protein n=1 Tax=Natronospira proteinivora TaxID=1807133 RepID=A0ABT1G7B6_9GAMM|nr:hypothetical protein [Natronospira proteinivora]